MKGVKHMKNIDRNWVQENIADNGIVEIPEGVERIEAQAFAINDKLKKVIMPDSVTEIGDKAFCLCKNLEEVQFSKNLKVIGKSAFSRCSCLNEIDLPDSLEIVGNCAFRKCTNLNKINLGKGITKVNVLTFDGCENLQVIEGGNNVNELDAGSFANTKIEHFNVPYNVENILARAMEDNLTLKSITLNKKVKYVSKRAFNNCNNLETIIINGTDRLDYSSFFKKSTIKRIVIDGQDIVLLDDEKLFSLQKNKEKVAIVIENKEGNMYTKALNLEKGIIKVNPYNLYITNSGKPCLALNNLAEVSLMKLTELKDAGIKQIFLYGGEIEMVPSENEKGFEFNLYDIDDLLKIKSKIEGIKKQVKLPDVNDKNKEKKIYGQLVRILSEIVEYDFWETETSKEEYESITRK